MYYMIVFNRLIVIPRFSLCHGYIIFSFWHFVIYNPLSKGYPKTDCHIVRIPCHLHNETVFMTILSLDLWFVSWFWYQRNWKPISENKLWGVGMVQWWEGLPPTNVSWVWFQRHMWAEFCWFSTLLQEVFLWELRFSPLLKNQHLIWFDIFDWLIWFTVSPISRALVLS